MLKQGLRPLPDRTLRRKVTIDGAPVLTSVRLSASSVVTRDGRQSIWSWPNTSTVLYTVLLLLEFR